MNGKRILIVDDNEVILKTLSFKLKARDYDVTTASDGSEAVASVRRQKPDLILLDISFPPEVSGVPWDGFRIIQWLRRTEDAVNIPIIIITSGEAEKYKARALAAGAMAYFQKPINHDELLALIHETVDGAEASKPEAKK
jgi:DNA-binding response OmpR family regulator